MYDSSRITFPRVRKRADGLSSNVIYGFAEGKTAGTLWIATESGLEFWDRTKNTFVRYSHDPQNPNSINDDICLGLYLDSSNDLWVVTQRGVARYDEKNDNFVRLDVRDDIDSSTIRTIFQDSRENYWYGTDDGLIFYSPESKIIHFYKNKPGDAFSIASNQIKQIFEDSLGYIWVSTIEGISRFSYENSSFANFRSSHDNPKSIGSNTINCFFEDDEAIWFGTSNGGLNKYNKKTRDFKVFSFYGDKYNTTIYSILEDGSGLLPTRACWFLTEVPVKFPCTLASKKAYKIMNSCPMPL